MADTDYTLDMELSRETAFKDAVLQGARQKADALVKRAEAKAKAQLAEARRACELAEEGRVNAQAAGDTAREAGGTEYAARQELLLYRRELVGALFAEVRGELVEFVQGDGYLPWLRGRLAAYAHLQNATVYLRAADMGLAGALADVIPGALFAQTDSFALGGCRVQDGTRLHDETLDARLHEAKKSFAARGALRL